MNTAKFLKAICLALIVLGALHGGAAGQSAAATSEPPRQPILRIETGMHTDPVRQISVDAASRYLVTIASDLTVRVWELATGRLLTTLRIPIFSDQFVENGLQSVAISPDGTTIAIGSFAKWEDRSIIYLLDRQSGRLKQRITSMTGELLKRLAYSRDGQFLATAVYKDVRSKDGSFERWEGGIRVYETARYISVAEDMRYPCEYIDFANARKLVALHFDGTIRVYDLVMQSGLSLRQITERKLAIRHIQKVSISPDGSKVVAVNKEQLEVFSANDLSDLYKPDTNGIGEKTELNDFAWSRDGKTLYACGYSSNKKGFIRRWINSGQGNHQDITVSQGPVWLIYSINEEDIVYIAADHSLGLLGASRHRKLHVQAANLNYREELLLSSDGLTARFNYQDGKSPTAFSPVTRQQVAAADSPTTFQPPIVTSNDFTITDWHGPGPVEPKLNGKVIRPNMGVANSLAIAPDSKSFVLAQGLGLRLLDSLGVMKWRTRRAFPLKVNIPRDGKFVVALIGDGTIRWYRLSDGKELLAFFPHADRKRWVLWTPQGYYDASPGAEDLIGWHVNNGKDQAADFFPIGQFRSVYYRPDVISRVLTAGDEAEALRLADADAGRKRQEAEVLNRLPPVVEIISPADGAEVSTAAVTVRYAVRAPSGEPVTSVKALIDGRPVALDRKLIQAKSEGQQLSVTIPERDCELALIAENKFATSVPAVVRLKWRGRAVAEEFVIKPKLYVLAVGVSRYANAEYNLGFPAKDARDFADVMRRQQGILYREVVVKLLVDTQATRDEVVDGLDWIRQQTTSKDVAMVFLAGHGVYDAIGRYFFCPHNIDPDKMLRTGVAFSDIKSAVESLAGKTVFFVDTCFSGNVLGGSSRRLTLFDINGFINELTSAENGAVVFAASTGKQVSLENREWNNGAFTKALVEGLGGAADYTRKGKITINSLDLYLAERVKELTRGRQTPTTTKPVTVPDFPIALKQ